MDRINRTNKLSTKKESASCQFTNVQEEEDVGCIDCRPIGLRITGVPKAESWDAAQRTNTHSKFAGVKRHECLQGHDSPNSGYEAKEGNDPWIPLRDIYSGHEHRRVTVDH